MNNKRVFISGGAGVIGSALVALLHSKGAKVFVGDLKPKPGYFPSDILYRQGDLNFISREELDAFQPELFIHLAATFERSTETYDFWNENFQHNLKLSNYLMSCLKDCKSLKRIVFASSYLIYNPDQYLFKAPAQKTLRLKETDPIYPRNLCGTAKLMHEMELKFLDHFNHSRYSSVSARIFRVYGKNSRDIISRWIRSLLKGEVLTVYKEEGMFDYIYAAEVAEGLLRLAESNLTGIVNLGNDNARRVSEVIEILKKHFPSLKYNHEESDIDFEASQANMDYFYSNLKWKPGRQIEDTIPELIEFEKKVGFSDNAAFADFNILITSISKKVPLIKAVKKASQKLGNRGIIIGGDYNEEAVAKYFVDQFWKMPKIDALKIEDLIKYCSDNKIRAIIPTRDGELEYFAKNKNTLTLAGIHVLISSQQAVEICIDKLKFFSNLNDSKFSPIKTVDNISVSEFSKFVVKERFGAGSRDIGLNLTREEALMHAKKLTAPIFQPFIQGKEYSIDLYSSVQGKVKGCIVRSRDLVNDGESEITTTVSNSKLEKVCIAIAEKLKLYGHVVFQAFIDSENNAHIIECNCRFGGASSLSIEAGLDSFYWFLLEVQGTDISTYSFHRSSKEKKQIRYKSDLIV